MDDFTTRKVDAFDLLTVTVMLEQCEPDLTMVRHIQRALPKRGVFWSDEVRYSYEEHRCCLACLLRRHGGTSLAPRTGVLNRVKRGDLQILDIYPRSELDPCTTCPPLQRF